MSHVLFSEYKFVASGFGNKKLQKCREEDKKFGEKSVVIFIPFTVLPT
jgi:hypothetical protein